jgi:uncharacterized protein
MKLSVAAERLAVSRLPADAEVPAWPRGAFVSITRTPEELSIVCDDEAVPDDVRAERGWRALSLEGPIPFETTGIAASLTAPLAAAHVSVFVISTYDTDWLLVKEESLDLAIGALQTAGYVISVSRPPIENDRL